MRCDTYTYAEERERMKRAIGDNDVRLETILRSAKHYWHLFRFINETGGLREVFGSMSELEEKWYEKERWEGWAERTENEEGKNRKTQRNKGEERKVPRRRRDLTTRYGATRLQGLVLFPQVAGKGSTGTQEREGKKSSMLSSIYSRMVENTYHKRRIVHPETRDWK
jgi:hypothetical protein